MTINEIRQAGILGDSDIVTIILPASVTRTARIRGHWYEDQIYEYTDREIAEMNYSRKNSTLTVEFMS